MNNFPYPTLLKTKVQGKPFYFRILLYTDRIYCMKKLFSLIVIAGFLFPALGHAATSSTSTSPVSVAATTDITSPTLQGKTLAAKKKAVEDALNNIYSQLSDLSDQTQTVVNQLNANGITTADTQANLLAANASLAKAKSDIATFATIGTPSGKAAGIFAADMMKYTAATAETSLHETKTQLIETLTSLEAVLPSLNAQ